MRRVSASLVLTLSSKFNSGSDPFVDNHSDSREPKSNPFVRPPGPTRKDLGRLAAYATAVLSVQYRTHLLMVFIVKNYARLIRWDSSGALVTTKIPFNEKTIPS